MADAKPLPSQTKLLYGIGAFGYGSVGQTMNSFLMFFGTGILGIPGALMGVAVGLSTIWDATTDPFVGYFSDKSKNSRWGKRHGFIFFGCIAVALSNILIWTISPTLSTGVKFTLLIVLLLVYETFCTIYSTPYQALGLDISKTYEDRTAVQGYRTTFGFLSLLVPSILMTIFLSPTRYATATASSRGYIEIALFTGALCLACGLICFFGTYKQRGQVTKDDNQPAPNIHGVRTILTEFFSIVRQKNVGRLILGYAISLCAAAFITSLGLHIFTYTFQFSTLEIPIIMVSLIVGIIGGQPLWFFVSKRTDKIFALMTALVVVISGILVFSIVLMFRNMVGDAVLPLVALTILVCGVGTGCLYSMPISMFADCIELETKRTGVDKTAISMGFATFCTKINNAFIMFVIGLSLDLIGFVGGMATQSLSVQNWLGWLLVCGVIVSCVCALFVYSGYTYSKKDFEQGAEN
jgi:Na+/melibiose symporter-like transporter